MKNAPLKRQRANRRGAPKGRGRKVARKGETVEKRGNVALSPNCRNSTRTKREDEAGTIRRGDPRVVAWETGREQEAGI